MATGSHTGGSMATSANRSPAGLASSAQAYRLLQRCLGSVPAWRLSPADAALLSRRARPHTYAAGEIIVPRGARADCLGLIALGRAAAGDRLFVAGSTFGEEMLAHALPNPVTLRALTRCEVWLLPRGEVLALLAKRRASRRADRAARVVPWVLLLAALAVAMALPSVRRSLVVVPMSVGEWCRGQGRGDCAGDAWRLAARMAPADVNPWLALGTLFFEQGDVAAAERAFDAALVLAPDSPEVYNNLGVLYAGQRRHEQAIAAYRRALELEPGNAAVEHNLAGSLQASRDREEALAHYQQAVALGDSRATTLANVAILYYEAGRPEDAGEAARQAIATDPGLAPAYAVLGALALGAGQPDVAVTEFHRAIGYGAADDRNYFYLGLAYQARGQPVEARAAFEKSLSVAGDEATRVRIRQHLAGLAPSSDRGGTN